MRVHAVAVIVLISLSVIGCNLATHRAPRTSNRTANSVDHGVETETGLAADFDTLDAPVPPICRERDPALESMAPRTVDELPSEFWDITLDEAVQLALQRSDVIRDVGGRVLTVPDGAVTAFDPGIEYTDPQFGVEAALSAFDANLTSRFGYEKNDRVFNNATLGGGATELQQNLSQMETALSKTAATGTQMNLRSVLGYDQNNRFGNLFGNVWETQWEAELRQPLLQGAGIAFNRIAGPNARPGLRFSNGVVIAQMNNDISKVDFEIAVRGLVSDVEEAYWQLYRSYLDFASKQETRLAAERTWKAVQAKYEKGLVGGEADQEAQSRAQFYLYHDLSVEALNGSAGVPGVYESERQLRRLLGLASNDGALLRPASTVSLARIDYDWDSLVAQAISRRAELRRQTWKVKQEELRLLAARNFLLPRLDATALYRLRGFGDDLVGGNGTRFSSAARDMANLDHQEWAFGLQLNVPIGRRQAYAGMRNAELRLARERSILREQELQVTHELANSIARAAQVQASLLAGRERMQAAQQRLAATEAVFEADRMPVDALLDAQERLGAAETRYSQLLAAYAVAEKEVRLASGNLLPSNGILLQGDCPMVYSPRPSKRRDLLDYRMQIPCPTAVAAQIDDNRLIR